MGHSQCLPPLLNRHEELNLAVIPGDGTGPEVTNEALKILKKISELEGFHLHNQNFLTGVVNAI